MHICLATEQHHTCALSSLIRRKVIKLSQRAWGAWIQLATYVCKNDVACVYRYICYRYRMYIYMMLVNIFPLRYARPATSGTVLQVITTD